MLKIVHCGDIHIGAPFNGLSPEQRSIRKGEVLSSFLRIIDFCNEKKADALLICGDLFDSPVPKKSDVSDVLCALDKLAGTQVYIICGNHDPMSPGSVFLGDGFARDYIHIFPTEGGFIENEKLNAAFFGVSYSSSNAQKNVALPTAKSGMYNILLLHGDVSSSGDYFVFSKEAIAKSGFDYAALGHIHSARIFNCGTVTAAYCGTPEPHGFDDDAAVGFIYCEIDAGTCRCEKVCRCARRYLHLFVDVTDLCSNDDVVKKICADICKDNLYRITLCGTLKNFEISLSYIQKQIEDRAFYIRPENETVPDYNIDEIIEEPGLRGIFLRRLRDCTKDDAAFFKAARMGLCALEDREELLRGEL